ncbi:MAG: YdcF family protein [Verrucomicrobia bacterium]|nr:YdcF family protein [Cytophagales bacterium]
MPETYQIGIVLTGMVDGTKPVKDRIFYGEAADRIIHTLELYKRGKIKKILITGASSQVMQMSDNPQEPSETEGLAKFLMMSGVPENDIILELKARNTRENALFSAEIVKKLYPNQPALLITSAFHMRRAKGCFEKVGLQVTTFSTDLMLHERKFNWEEFLLPSEGNFAKSSVLIHEITGFLVYKIQGYC